MYPIVYESDFDQERNRLTTFFRIIVSIPWIIVGYIYGIAAVVTVIVAWFAVVILGRYPEGLYNLNAGFLRYGARLNGFLYLLTDEFPPFGLSEDDSYPVRLHVAPAAESQSRLKAFFRIILALPLLVLAYAINFLHIGAVLASWLTIVFRGYQPAGVHNALLFTNAWQARLGGYVSLLTDTYPPVGDERAQPGDIHLQAGTPASPAVGGATTTPEDPGQHL